MKTKYLKKFLDSFHFFILKEKNDNQPISGNIINIKNNRLLIDLKVPTNISNTTPIEINKISGHVLKNNYKKLLIKINHDEYFQKNQEVNIINTQQEIIIKKLENVYNQINDNKINQSNMTTLDSLITIKDTTYSENKYNNPKLNKNQNEAVQKSISTNKFHIIKGPPGTGKTHTIVEIINELYKENYKILVTTHTHVALDNIVEKLTKIPSEDILRLGKNEKISSNNKQYTLEEQIKKHPKYQEIIKNNIKINSLKNNNITKKDYFPDQNRYLNNTKFNNTIFRFLTNILNKSDKNETFTDENTTFINDKSNIKNQDLIIELEKENHKISDEISQELINNSKIIATTVLSVSSYLTKDLEWDYIIIDEASQVPLYLALIPLIRTDKFILIGDDNQLQPINNNNASYLLNKSIFNLYIQKYPTSYTFLNIQYRMNKQISDISSYLYYDNKILTYSKVQNAKISLNNDNILVTDEPVEIIDTSYLYFYESNVSNSCCNKFEADIIINIIDILLKNNISSDEIGIITPYRKQKNYIQKLMNKHNFDIETDTIYRFQGREKDVIIISFCKSSANGLTNFQKKFLGDKNQLNVSITRSRKKLIIIGNLSLLKQSKNIDNIINCINPLNILYLNDLF
ncbi:MAG: hypothetical protein E7Z84_00420 [Methanosphaera stadtmanae]|nr:hypothetical protein [Methanosphaera stadtmanae]